MLKSLPTLEKEAEGIVKNEVVVIMQKEMLDKLKDVFDFSKERGKEEDIVETTELIANIAEDEYFNPILDQPVRENTDGVKESLEDLLHRVLKCHKATTIEWFTFLGFFSRRGQIRDNEKINLQLNRKNKQASEFEDEAPEGAQEEEDPEMKKYRLKRELKQTLVRKQNLVPKTGKGKFNVTVPVPFEFMNQEKGFSIRQKKVEQMIKEKKREEEKALAFEYRAREVPKNVKENKFEKLMKSQEDKRQEAKRLAVAKIKASEAPFKFYERDLKAQKEKNERASLPKNVSDYAAFRAGKIPWRCLVPLYRAMVDEYEQAREKRVKRNAEISLSLSKLPPRMEEYQKRKEKLGLQRANSAGPKFQFKPPAPRQVPDFKRLHKEFAQKLENNKSAQKLTNIQPFHFHEPKNDPSLRKHLDEENQLINPTKKAKRSRSAGLNRDIFDAPVKNPPTTKKHDALVALRRSTQNQKLTAKTVK